MRKNLIDWSKKDKVEQKWKRTRKSYKNKSSNYRNILTILNSNIGISKSNMKDKF